MLLTILVTPVLGAGRVSPKAFLSQEAFVWLVLRPSPHHSFSSSARKEGSFLQSISHPRPQASSPILQ